MPQHQRQQDLGRSPESVNTADKRYAAQMLNFYESIILGFNNNAVHFDADPGLLKTCYCNVL